MNIPGLEIIDGHNKSYEVIESPSKYEVKYDFVIVYANIEKLRKLGWQKVPGKKHLYYEFKEEISTPPSEEIVRFENEGGSILPPVSDHDDIEE